MQPPDVGLDLEACVHELKVLRRDALNELSVFGRQELDSLGRVQRQVRRKLDQDRRRSARSSGGVVTGLQSVNEALAGVRDLRHMCASLLIAAGAHPHSIKEHLGHSDIRTTFNVYGHQLPSAREALSTALDIAYEGAGTSGEDIASIR